MSDKIYIVWNAVRTEGFVTVDKHLAYEARKDSDTNCFDADGPFAKQENRCDANLPFPLKKIAK